MDCLRNPLLRFAGAWNKGLSNQASRRLFIHGRSRRYTQFAKGLLRDSVITYFPSIAAFDISDSEFSYTHHFPEVFGDEAPVDSS